MPDPANKSKQIGVRFNSGDLEYIEGKANEWKVTISEAIRRMVLVYRITNGEQV